MKPLLLALCLLACDDPDFSEHWHDGKAELSGYRLSVTRYGEPRAGEAVAIYVTEPFSERDLVKRDDPRGSDVIDALKLNLVRDFPTGIYDYDTMTSVFVRSADFSPMKVSFTSAEWCGHVYEEDRFRADTVEVEVASYFEGESGTRRLERPRGGVDEASLFVLLRGLRGDYLAEGAERRVAFLPGPFHRRLTHRPAEWTSATIRRAAGTQAVEVPAGTFECSEYVVTVEGGRTGRFLVERARPQRIVRWSWTDAEGGTYEGAHSGELLGTERLAYWRLQAEGDRARLRELGLGLR